LPLPVSHFPVETHFQNVLLYVECDVKPYLLMNMKITLCSFICYRCAVRVYCSPSYFVYDAIAAYLCCKVLEIIYFINPLLQRYSAAEALCFHHAPLSVPCQQICSRGGRVHYIHAAEEASNDHG